MGGEGGICSYGWEKFRFREGLNYFLTVQNKILGFPTRMVYLYNDVESRYTVLVGNPLNASEIPPL